MQESVRILIERSKRLMAEPYSLVKFTGNDEADKLLNDLERFPHAFVLACLMDRQMKAERAAMIPHIIAGEIGDFSFTTLVRIEQNTITDLFETLRLHRFNRDMAEIFYLAIRRIADQYHGNAAAIWQGKPRSATVVRRMLQFKGAGIKIATLAANVLVRDFKIPLADKLCIDISPDVQVRRTFERLGLIDLGASNDELIYCARELHPEYPGIFDYSAWEIGREWCRPTNPACDLCYLEPHCPKVGVC